MAAPAPVLVLIAADPRHTHRAFEAMRIGVGIVAGDHPVVLVLTHGAVHLLDADTDALVEGDEVAKFRATLRSLDVPFHVEAAHIPSDPDWNPEAHPIVPVSREEIAELIRRARHCLVFT